MLENLKYWVITILISAFIVNLVEMILPESKLKPYINTVINFLFVFMIITPIISFFSEDNSLEDKILTIMNNYNKEYSQSVKNLDENANIDKVNKSYEKGVEEVIKLKLSEEGYELESIEFDDLNIQNIKIKEKTSNNEEDTSIKSKEKTKEVFNENTQKEEIKDNLVEILDISIETIQID